MERPEEDGYARGVKPERPVYGSELPSHWQPWWDSYELKLLGDFRQTTTLGSYHDVMVQFSRFLSAEGRAPDQSGPASPATDSPVT